MTAVRKITAPGDLPALSGRMRREKISSAWEAPFSFSLVLIIGAVFLSSCSSSPRPTDSQLIDKFRANETAFESLASSPNNPELRKIVGIKKLSILSSSPKEFLFAYYVKDYAGPGGCSKGIAYLEKKPKDLLDHLDDNPAAAPPNQGIFYRQITGHWYVYFENKD